MIGLFITYLYSVTSSCRARQQHVDITVITLSATEATDVYQEFQKFSEADPRVVSTKITRPRAETQLVPGETTKEELDSCVKLIVENCKKAINTYTPLARSSCLVLFISPPEDLPQFVIACSEATGTKISPKYLTRHSTPEEIDLVMQETKPQIICIDPSFPSVLILNITHMISSGTKAARLFDQDSSHFVSGRVSLTFNEHLWEDAWASASTNPNIRFMVTSEPPDTPYKRPKHPLEEELFYLAYHIVRHWQSVPHSDIPIPCLRHQNSSRLHEMFRRLKDLSLIQRGPDDRWMIVLGVKISPIYYTRLSTPVGACRLHV